MEQTGPKGEGEERPTVRAADTGHRASTAAQCSALRVGRLEPYGYIVYSLCCNFFLRVTNVRGTSIAVATLLLVAFRLDVVVVVVDSRNPSIATCRGSFCLTFVFEQF